MMVTTLSAGGGGREPWPCGELGFCCHVGEVRALEARAVTPTSPSNCVSVPPSMVVHRSVTVTRGCGRPRLGRVLRVPLHSPDISGHN